MTVKTTGRWSIPDGESYKRAEKMFYCRQLGMTFREIGEKFGICGTHVRQIILRREIAVKCHLRSKELDEQRLGLK